MKKEKKKRDGTAHHKAPRQNPCHFLFSLFHSPANGRLRRSRRARSAFTYGSRRDQGSHRSPGRRRCATFLHPPNALHLQGKTPIPPCVLNPPRHRQSARPRRREAFPP